MSVRVYRVKARHTGLKEGCALAYVWALRNALERARIVDFAYEGALEVLTTISPFEMMQVAKVAHILQVRKVFEFVRETCINSLLCESNCAEFFALASATVGMQELLQACQSMAVERFSTVSISQHFPHIAEGHLIPVVRDDLGSALRHRRSFRSGGSAYGCRQIVCAELLEPQQRCAQPAGHLRGQRQLRAAPDGVVALCLHPGLGGRSIRE